MCKGDGYDTESTNEGTHLEFPEILSEGQSISQRNHHKRIIGCSASFQPFFIFFFTFRKEKYKTFYLLSIVRQGWELYETTRKYLYFSPT